MKNKKLVLKILLSILTIVIIISVYYVVKNNDDVVKMTDDGEHEVINSDQNLVWVYDTNQYQSYKQFTYLVKNNPPETFTYNGEVLIGDTEFYQYEIEDITVEVISWDSYHDKNLHGAVDYTISYQGKTYAFQEKMPPYPEGLFAYYVDINKDSVKDVIIRCEPYSGSNSTYYWMRAIDLISMSEIGIFQAEGDVRLTDKQTDDFKIMIKDDPDFNRLFPDYEWLGNYANPLVDCYGNIYYEIGLGKNIFEDIGSTLLLFDYDKEAKSYDLADYECIPTYVTK